MLPAARERLVEEVGFVEARDEGREPAAPAVAHFQDDEAHGRRRAALVRILRGQPIFSDKVYNIFNRELQKYQ